MPVLGVGDRGASVLGWLWSWGCAHSGASVRVGTETGARL